MLVGVFDVFVCISVGRCSLLCELLCLLVFPGILFLVAFV